jgi:hypothetical protein
LQNSPLESSRVVVALVENYSTSKRLKVYPEKSQILICDTVVLSQMSDTFFQKSCHLGAKHDKLAVRRVCLLNRYTN